MSSPSGKVRSIEELVEERERWRADGLRVVLVNGAFDMLHVGHLRYLAGAREHADHLVAAVNSDASVRGSKGDTRPVIPEAERVEILRASAQRRAAPCPVQEQCGGCPWMPLAYEAQLAWKESLVRDALERIGGLGRAHGEQPDDNQEAAKACHLVSFRFQSQIIE